jgi:hypothetical protein
MEHRKTRTRKGSTVCAKRDCRCEKPKSRGECELKQMGGAATGAALGAAAVKALCLVGVCVTAPLAGAVIIGGAAVGLCAASKTEDCKTTEEGRVVA